MSPDSWSAIAGCASAVAAGISLFVTWKGIHFQKQAFRETLRRNIQDALTYQAERANLSSTGKSDAEWTFPQFANIILAIDTARNMVSRLDKNAGMSKEEAGEYFLERLNHNIVNSFRKGSPPDGAFQSKGPISEIRELVTLWNANAHFLGFRDVNFSPDL